MLRQLQAQILKTLRQHPNQGLSEYDLIRALQLAGLLPSDRDSLSEPICMFRTHFLVFHCLYHLRDRLWAKKLAHIDISPLRLFLDVYKPTAEGLSALDPLRAYYLDLKQLSSTTEEDINDILSVFWSKMNGQECSSDNTRQLALSILELSDPIDYKEIRTQYRRLAMLHHPDRGGSNEKLKKINQAMATLSNCYRSHMGKR